MLLNHQAPGHKTDLLSGTVFLCNNLSPSCHYSFFRTLTALSMLFLIVTPLIYTLFAQRCLGICSYFRFKGILSLVLYLTEVSMDSSESRPSFLFLPEARWTFLHSNFYILSNRSSIF
ncbi:hypothetical protein BYT27DRAFT_6764533 [Phlegmacium glaucopus]|nr:hypothetical protein BYT27DRAFT_6764533 [Phlegmacium glaucopus]